MMGAHCLTAGTFLHQRLEPEGVFLVWCLHINDNLIYWMYSWLNGPWGVIVLSSAVCAISSEH